MDNPRIMTDEMWSEIKSVIGSAFTQAPDGKLKGFLYRAAEAWTYLEVKILYIKLF